MRRSYPRRRLWLVALSAWALTLISAPGALASHSFPADVPDSHQFHNEIGIFKDTNITVGCSATAFCPQDFVRRQAMAAFIDRALGLVVRPGETTQRAVPGSRVAMIDDDQSFVGTSGNALRYWGPDNNVIGGACPFLGVGVVGATIAGGGQCGGGASNTVTGNYGSVGGGSGNTAGEYATVPGGSRNTASGLGSLAAGIRARATHAGSFVWNGYWSAEKPYGDSPADYSFTAYATGGVNFWTNTSGTTTGCSIPAGGGSWACTSDRNVKENFRPVDGRRVFERVARLPITSWNYRGQKDRFRHIGPTAQDFKAAFGVGEGDKAIAMVDADGVALAAIKALIRENRAQDRQIATLTRELRELKGSSR